MVGDARENGILGFERFAALTAGALAEMNLQGLWEGGVESVFFYHNESIGEGRGVGRGGSGADNAEGIAEDIRENKARDCGGMGKPGKLAAFDPREMFADAVDFGDIGPGSNQLPMKLDNIFRVRFAGAVGEQGGGAAGKEAEKESVFPGGAGGQACDFGRGAEPRRIGRGVAGFGHLDAAQGNRVTMFDNNMARNDAVAQSKFGLLRHRANGFAGADNIDPTMGWESGEPLAKVRTNEPPGFNFGQACEKDFARCIAVVHGHGLTQESPKMKRDGNQAWAAAVAAALLWAFSRVVTKLGRRTRSLSRR